VAAIDFPSAPTVGQTFTPANGVIYTWSGTLWLASGTSAGGDVSVFTASAGSSASPVTVTWQTLISGNSGSWLNLGTGRYTPPAGRYKMTFILTGNSSAGMYSVSGYITKNGALLTANAPSDTTSAASNNSTMVFDAIVDANGSDYFECVSATSAASSVGRAWFNAFPISGIKGPPGDPGQLGFRLLQRVVPTAGQATVDVTSLPSDINDLELRFSVLPTAGSTVLGLRFFDAVGTIVTTSSYSWQGSYTSSAQTAGAFSPAINSIMAGGGFDAAFYLSTSVDVSTTTGIFGRATINNIRDTTVRKGINWQAAFNNSANTAQYSVVVGGVYAATTLVSGLRLFFNGTTFAAGGAFSVWGSP